MNTSGFHPHFDPGDSILDALDWSQARRQRLDRSRLNVDVPFWVAEPLDQETSRMGATRQSDIKI
ncbi:MAG: CopG family transcriptional regulator [Cyanobacteriota bacterium]|nr:CopG family transcriptional regulator [Cyanobacteriota bacterium]